MPSNPTLTNATCSITWRDCPSRLSRKRQLSRFRPPICARSESRTSKSEARENQPSKRRAISSRPWHTSGPGGESKRACACGARHSANRPKSRAARAEMKTSGADWLCMRPKVAAARSAEHQPFGRFSCYRRRPHERHVRGGRSASVEGAPKRRRLPATPITTPDHLEILNRGASRSTLCARAPGACSRIPDRLR